MKTPLTVRIHVEDIDGVAEKINVLQREKKKLEEELRIAQSDKRDLESLIIRLNMRYIMGQ